MLVCPTVEQSTYEPIRDHVTRFVTDTQELQALQDLTKRRPDDEPALLVIDDCSGESWTHPSGRKGILPVLTNNARWLSLSIVIITQNISSITPSMRENAEGFMMFQSLNAKEIDYLVEERNSLDGDRREMKALYHRAIREPHDFLMQVITREGVVEFRNWQKLLHHSTHQ